jgi:diketogulonate reductase-like aldo/keto reductase
MSFRESIIPFFMYGTAWKENQTEKLTFLALQNGFRAIDTANQRKHYYEEGVGRGISKFLDLGNFQREDLFIQTKFTYQEGQDHRLPYDPKSDYTTQVNQSFRSSLDHLKTEYLDSYILHGPSTNQSLKPKDYEVWRAMESLQRQGLTKHIGVSNINANQLGLLLDKAEIKPTFIQNRCFAITGWNQEIRKICNENNIIYQGFSLLTANQKFLNSPEIKSIAQKYDMPVTSVIFCFANQLGILPLTGTSQENHMKKDLLAIELQLTSAELSTVENIAL